MPRKNKTRRLWLEIRALAPGVKDTKVIMALIHSIERGDYKYPNGWKVALGWSNREHNALKWGEFTREMKKSAQSSEGWKYAVQSYLENQL